MGKKILLSACALLLLLAANLHISYTVSVNGQELAGYYSPKCAREAYRVSSLAAEELCIGEEKLPEVRARRRLRLGKDENDVCAFTDRVLRETKGVEAAKLVYVNGKRLGAVRESCDLQALLERNIVNQMPNAAVRGRYTGSIAVSPRYTRSALLTPPSDMVLLVSGMAPVLYTDDAGQPA